eukprot:2430452-Rhodomonas_salina.2
MEGGRGGERQRAIADIATHSQLSEGEREGNRETAQAMRSRQQKRHICSKIEAHAQSCIERSRAGCTHREEGRRPWAWRGGRGSGPRLRTGSCVPPSEDVARPHQPTITFQVTDRRNPQSHLKRSVNHNNPQSHFRRRHWVVCSAI